MCTKNALESELQAFIFSMQNCWCKRYRRVIFEGDDKGIIDLINGKKLNFGSFNWIWEARFWRDHFEEFQFRWTTRESNEPADILAKQNIPNNLDFYFHFYVPHVISQAIHCGYSLS